MATSATPPDVHHFSHWGLDSSSNELFHLRSGHRIALSSVLSGSGAVLNCIFDMHDKPWCTAKVLDELVELLGTYLKGQQMVRNEMKGQGFKSDVAFRNAAKS
jgi:hypothetical protein